MIKELFKVKFCTYQRVSFWNSLFFLIIFFVAATKVPAQDQSSACSRFKWLMLSSMAMQEKDLAYKKVRQVFETWLAPKKIGGQSFRDYNSSIEQIPKKILQELYLEFEATKFKEFKRYKGQLKKLFDQRIAQDELTLKKMQDLHGPHSLGVLFKVSDLLEVKKLGSGLEGEVFLSYINNELVINKVFTNGSETAKMHEDIFNLLNSPELTGQLSKSNISVAQVKLREGSSLVLNFQTGVLHNDLLALQREGKLPVDFWETYSFMHALFLKDLLEIVADKIKSLTGQPYFFIPHANNVAYNPITESWFIFDVH